MSGSSTTLQQISLRAALLALLVAVLSGPVVAEPSSDEQTTAASASVARTVVRFDTVEGMFDVELFDDLMPRTVANFLGYVTSGRYDGSVVHRNSDTGFPPRDFVIQGGGFFLHDPEPPETTNIWLTQVAVDRPIDDEPGDGVAGPSNLRGTIAMAKSGIDTVTSQWFFNQGDNSVLDAPERPDGGFSAFGVVLGDGMEVVDAIGDLPLPSDFGFGIKPPFNDLPLRNFPQGGTFSDIREVHTVVVHSITVVPEPSKAAGAVVALAGALLLGRRRARSRLASPRQKRAVARSATG